MQFYNALCEGNNAPHNMLAQYFGQITAQLAATASSKSNPGGQIQSQAPTSQYAGFSGEKNYNFSQAETSGTYVFGSDRQNTQTSTSTQRQPPNPFSVSEWPSSLDKQSGAVIIQAMFSKILIKDTP